LWRRSSSAASAERIPGGGHLSTDAAGGGTPLPSLPRSAGGPACRGTSFPGRAGRSPFEAKSVAGACAGGFTPSSGIPSRERISPAEVGRPARPSAGAIPRANSRNPTPEAVAGGAGLALEVPKLNRPARNTSSIEQLTRQNRLACFHGDGPGGSDGILAATRIRPDLEHSHLDFSAKSSDSLALHFTTPVTYRLPRGMEFPSWLARRQAGGPIGAVDKPGEGVKKPGWIYPTPTWVPADPRRAMPLTFGVSPQWGRPFGLPSH
jgi:hypothetical protein